MNLFLLLHALGLGHDLHGEHLLPIGTVYDPFVCRGLDALIYGLYSGSRFVVVGTPAGVTLAPEGGAHQSTITPSIGLELPGLTYAEPAFARALDWLLCDGLADLGAAGRRRRCTCACRRGRSTRRRSPTAVERLGDDRLRADVLAGGYRLREPRRARRRSCSRPAGRSCPRSSPPPQALGDEGVPALVLDLTSPDRALPRPGAATLRDGGADGPGRPTDDHHLASLLAPARAALPIVTVHDAASHHLAWLGSVFGARVVPVGVDEFGQSGSIAELYGMFDLLPEQIVNAALVAMT